MGMAVRHHLVDEKFHPGSNCFLPFLSLAASYGFESLADGVFYLVAVVFLNFT
jgi:hypothetical protein